MKRNLGDSMSIQENIKKAYRQYKWIWVVLGLILLAGLPFISSNLVIRIFTTIFIYSLLAMGNMVITGYTGMLNMGSAAFYGVGAYIAAVLQLRWDVPFLVCLVLAAIGTSLCGLLVALPCLRLRSDFISLITIAFLYIFLAVARNWMSVTRGPMGLTGIPQIKIFGHQFSTPIEQYLLLFAFVILIYFLLNNLINSKTGRSMQATRDDEIGARSVGVNTDVVKILSFIIGTGVMGLAGATYASYIGYVSPNNFVFDVSLTIMQMCIIGGLGSLPGAIVGASFFVVMPEIIRPLAVYRVGIGGLIMIVFMLFRPQGIMGSRAFATEHGLQEQIKRKRLERMVKNKNNC